VRFFWLPARIALLFALLMALLLVLALTLFGRVVGRDLIREVGAIRAQGGVLLAERIEHLCETGALDSPECAEALKTAERESGMEIALLDRAGRLVAGTQNHPGYTPHGGWEETSVKGRPCEIAGPPGLQARIPVFQGGRQVATLVLWGTYHSQETHAAFMHGLVAIGLAGLLGIVLLSLYLTSPLRRMSRSMDRIAAGDLEHRVKVRGRDEVAAVGRSFNAMAGRIQKMLLGQRELLAGASHEIRSPLARMKVSLELLRGEGAPSGRVADLEADVDALNELVEELTVASRLDLDPAAISPQRLSLVGLAGEAWKRAAQAADQAGMRLRLDIAEEAREIVVDPALGLRLLGNLFENCVRYASRGEVVLASRALPGSVEVSVSDGGPGVAEEHLERLFEPFFRVDPSRSRKTGASGLGLMIVQRAVQAHGGQVAATRSAQGGLCVTFRLPV